VPLFAKFLILSKVTLYLISWFTTSVDDFMINKPLGAIFDFQLWRLFTCPYVTASLFGDLLFVLPVYLAIYMYPKEWNYGTLYAFFYFNLVNVAVQLVSSAVTIPIAMFDSDGEDKLEWAFFSLFMVEQYRHMMTHGDNVADLIWFKLQYKYLIFAVLLLLWLVFGYDLSNCIAVAFVGQCLVFGSRSQLLQTTVLRVDKTIPLFANFMPNYIGALEAKKHLDGNTDNLTPFDRRTIRGNVQKALRQRDLQNRWENADSTNTAST